MFEEPDRAARRCVGPDASSTVKTRRLGGLVACGTTKTRGSEDPDARWIMKTRRFEGLGAFGSEETRDLGDPDVQRIRRSNSP